MDFLTKQEIEKLKGEITAKDFTIEAEKYSFERKLKNGLGNEILNVLNNPPKPSFLTKLKIKYAKWKFLKNEKKRIKNNEGL